MSGQSSFGSMTTADSFEQIDASALAICGIAELLLYRDDEFVWMRHLERLITMLTVGKRSGSEPAMLRPR